MKIIKFSPWERSISKEWPPCVDNKFYVYPEKLACTLEGDVLFAFLFWFYQII